MILAGRSGSERGMTRIESTLLVSALVVGVVIGAAVLLRTYSLTVGEMHHATVQNGKAFTHEAAADAPVSVNVVAAGTVAEPVDAPADVKSDHCEGLPGIQSATFDCALPLYVTALDLAASNVKARYQCADRINYELVGGQGVEPEKKCVLKSAHPALP